MKQEMDLNSNIPLINDSNIPQYVMSLDAINLDYIPNFNKYTGPGITEIWVKKDPTRRDTEYYEFEIKEECENEDSENRYHTLIPCYMCDIDIPKIFFEEHLNSEKHKSFKKIINISLDRMKKVINNEVICKDTYTDLKKSKYFCASCVAVVETNDRITHEKSLVHRNSLAVDNILSDFLNLYIDNKDFGKGGEEVNTFQNIKNKEIAKIEEHSTELPATSNDLFNVNFLNKSKNYNNIQVEDCRNMKIKTKSGRKVQFPEEHYHSITRKSKRLCECILCSATLKRNFVQSHLYEEGHVKRIMMPFADEHCLRQIDASWTHCALCNTKVHIQHQTEHKLDVNHKLYLIKALNLSNGDITLENKKKIDFEKNTNEQSHPNGLNTPLRNDNTDSKKSYSETLKRQYSETSEHNGHNTHRNENTSREIKELAHTYNTNQKQNIPISNEKPTAVPSHVANVNSQSPAVGPSKDDHEQNTDPSLPDHVVLKCAGTHINDYHFYCAICNINIPNHNYNIYTHLTCARHIKAAIKYAKQELVNVHYHMDLTKFPKLECLLCKRELPLNNPHNITSHILGLYHVHNHKLLLEHNKIVLGDNKLYFCNVCTISIQPMCELVHCQTKAHLERLPSLKNETTNDPDVDKDTPSTSSSNTPKDNVRKYLLKNVDDPNILLCLVCNVNVPNNINNINTHLTGKRHSDNYQTLLENNEIRPVGKNFTCELCGVILRTGRELTHIDTDYHCIVSKMLSY